MNLTPILLALCSVAVVWLLLVVAARAGALDSEEVGQWAKTSAWDETGQGE